MVNSPAGKTRSYTLGQREVTRPRFFGGGEQRKKLAETKTVKLRGQDYLVADEEFKIHADDWNEYETASGVKVRVRLIVNQIARVLDTDGNPVL